MIPHLTTLDTTNTHTEMVGYICGPSSRITVKQGQSLYGLLLATSRNSLTGMEVGMGHADIPWACMWGQSEALSGCSRGRCPCRARTALPPCPHKPPPPDDIYSGTAQCIKTSAQRDRGHSCSVNTIWSLDKGKKQYKKKKNVQNKLILIFILCSDIVRTVCGRDAAEHWWYSNVI